MRNSCDEHERHFTLVFNVVCPEGSNELSGSDLLKECKLIGSYCITKSKSYLLFSFFLQICNRDDRKDK